MRIDFLVLLTRLHWLKLVFFMFCYTPSCLHQKTSIILEERFSYQSIHHRIFWTLWVIDCCFLIFQQGLSKPIEPIECSRFLSVCQEIKIFPFQWWVYWDQFILPTDANILKDYVKPVHLKFYSQIFQLLILSSMS